MDYVLTKAYANLYAPGRNYFAVPLVNYTYGDCFGGDANKGSEFADQSDFTEIETYSFNAANGYLRSKYRFVYDGVKYANDAERIANLTAEASSRFGKDADNALKAFGVAWGIFPGVQASWVMSNESWFAGVRGIDYLRLTAGFDVSGNDDLDYYAARSYFSSNNFLDVVSGLSFENIGNTNLQWETTKRFNAGFESNFINNRLNVRFNYFRSNTDHLLMFQTLGFLSGLERNWSNGGSMKNEGFDVTAVGKVLSLKDFQWELGASMGHYVNKITKLSDNQTAFDTDVYGATIRTEIGHSANAFYGYKSLGVFATSEEAAAANLYVLADNGIDHNYFGAGDIHFDDINGDHQIT